MIFDAWIYAKKAEWDNIPDEFSQCYISAKTGYWKSFGAYDVYNVVGTQDEIQAVLDQLSDVGRVFAWSQGPAIDSLDPWPTNPDDILAVMQDVPVDETTSVPATFENPNWGHAFLGQKHRIFAGQFSDDFSGEFL